MQIPNHILVAPIIPMSGVDAALHTFVGVSWHILLPYTLLGALLMVYSQSRLMHGQRMMNREARTSAPSGHAKSEHK